jgi:hypothetical protein
MKLFVCLTLMAAPPPSETEGRTAVSASLVLKVTNRDSAADALIDAAEKRGGWFATRDDHSVVLVVPVQRVDELVAEVEPLGVVVERTFAAEDVTSRLREQRTRLASRKEVFERYFAVLQRAGHGTVVEVESQMTSLVQEIEDLKGSIKLLEHQLAYARVTVQFQFRDRRPPARSGDSSFGWLNTVNLVDLFAEFSHVR